MRKGSIDSASMSVFVLEPFNCSYANKTYTTVQKS